MASLVYSSSFRKTRHRHADVIDLASLVHSSSFRKTRHHRTDVIEESTSFKPNSSVDGDCDIVAKTSHEVRPNTS